MKRRVSAELILESEQYDIESIAEVIGIYPFCCRTEFPSGSIAKPYWSTEITLDADSIEEPLNLLKERIISKEEIIKKMVNEGKVSFRLLIKVRADYFDRPEMVISPELYCFWGTLGAKMIFDVAYEE